MGTAHNLNGLNMLNIDKATKIFRLFEVISHTILIVSQCIITHIAYMNMSYVNNFTPFLSYQLWYSYYQLFPTISTHEVRQYILWPNNYMWCGQLILIIPIISCTRICIDPCHAELILDTFLSFFFHHFSTRTRHGQLKSFLKSYSLNILVEVKEGLIFQVLILYTWWHHQMETFFTLLAFNCAANSTVNCEFPAQMQVTWSFDAYVDLQLNQQLSKQ